jgi:hypothetical protein
MAFLTQNSTILCKKIILTSVFKKITIFRKNMSKPPKIVITALTPGHNYSQGKIMYIPENGIRKSRTSMDLRYHR